MIGPLWLPPRSQTTTTFPRRCLSRSRRNGTTLSAVKKPSASVAKYSPSRWVTGETLSPAITDTFLRCPPSPAITGVCPIFDQDAPHQRIEKQPGFVDQDEVGLVGRRFFCMRGQSVLIQRSMASGFFCLARRRGFWGLQPR